ncbi:MAG: phosphonate C-P lyase system protein PhnH [Pseudomonadota bacterium]
MQTDVLGGGFADAPVDAARAFRAAMNAMARPGRIETVTGAVPPAPLSIAAGVLLLMLCDTGTPVYLAGTHDCDTVRDWITFHTAAPFSDADRAAFAVGPWQALPPLESFRQGTSEYPDRSATLIVEMPVLTPAGARLTGPGIQRAAMLNLPDIAAMQRNARYFPLGVDFFLTCTDRLAALPRTTQVEAL